MSKLHYVCKRGIMIAFSLLLFISCQESDLLNESGVSETDLSVEEAQAFFEDEVMKAATRSQGKSMDYYASQFMLPLGDIVPYWKDKTVSSTRNLSSVDVPIASSYSYRVLQTDPVTGKSRRVKCYHKLVVVKNAKTEKMGNYIVFFIATNQYSKSNRGIISDWFNNDGNMGDFSGLKIYTNLEGRIVRVNKYVNGQKTNGVYLGGKMDKNAYIRKITIVRNAMKYMKFQQGTKSGVMTRGESGGDITWEVELPEVEIYPEDDSWDWQDDYPNWDDDPDPDNGDDGYYDDEEEDCGEMQLIT
ncbi:hypothetical protein [Bacteroides sp. 51]|uniref:hypothetical protein n=1 Tax=Bacteroides sp. 51 TaxID=2302938 RepID=UPI0013D41715|nr:hypothetical protein [Bacteroides sp. 51]NDV81879.1 hypothetical protein [Bacteroides sp. 51]